MTRIDIGQKEIPCWTNLVSLSLYLGRGGIIATWRCLNQKAGEPAQQHEAGEGVPAAQPVEQEVRQDVGGDLHRSTVHMKRQETYRTYSMYPTIHSALIKLAAPR